MKILGLTYSGEFYVKGDSALLVNGKPFFVPDFSGQFEANECIIVKISKLGKNISEKFAERYYDELTFGYDVQAINEQNWARRTSFDNSLIVGTFVGKDASWVNDYASIISRAICEVSKIMTLRMGDMVCVDMDKRFVLEREQILYIEKNGTQLLRCKIK